MTDLHEYTPAPRKRPEIVRILIYTVITLGVNLALAIPYSLVYRALVQGLRVNGGMSSTAFSVISFFLSSLHAYGLCIIKGLLYRRLVFRSKTSAFLPILVMCGLNDVFGFFTTIINTIAARFIGYAQFATLNVVLSYLSLIIVATLGYIIMRCGFYKRTLDTLVKRDEPAPAEDLPCGAEEGV